MPIVFATVHGAGQDTMSNLKRNTTLGHERSTLAVALEGSNCDTLIYDDSCLNVDTKHVVFLMEIGEDIAILPYLDWPGIYYFQVPDFTFW